MNIPALEANVEELDRQIARLERELADMRFERQLTVNDIAAARLQAWYAANPGIELRVGDQLAVTDEFMESSTLGAVWWDDEDYPIEEVCFLDGENFPSVLIYETDAGNPEYVPIDTARRMREAWLAQEAGA